MIDTYTRLLEATALLEDKAHADVAVTKLILHLKSAGRLKMLPQIARELRKVVSRRTALQPKIEVAHRSEEAAALRAAATLGITANHAKVNPTLIHGWRAQSHGQLIDHSAKRALIDIYQKVTI